jgi:Tfp pilus assembly protein PilP
LFVLLSEVSRVGVVPPASGLTLTILVKSMSIRDLVANVLWTLGLHPNGDEKVFTALPPDVAPAIRKGEPGGLDLSAAEAPLSLLVDALAGRPGVIACGEDPLLTMRVRDASRHNLLELLLTGRGMTLKKSGGKTYLVPKGAGLDPKKCTETDKATVERLYAVMKENKKPLALLNDSGRLRWVAEGDKLNDGREVRRIKTSRVVLRGPDRKLISLFPDMKPDCPPAGCMHRLDPTAKALSRFRLAGTAITKKSATAALVDEEGRVFLVRKGHLLGRRCGRVSAVEAGRIGVKMECAQKYDPKVVWISLRSD